MNDPNIEEIINRLEPFVTNTGYIKSVRDRLIEIHNQKYWSPDQLNEISEILTQAYGLVKMLEKLQ